MCVHITFFKNNISPEPSCYFFRLVRSQGKKKKKNQNERKMKRCPLQICQGGYSGKFNSSFPSSPAIDHWIAFGPRHIRASGCGETCRKRKSICEEQNVMWFVPAHSKIEPSQPINSSPCPFSGASRGPWSVDQPPPRAPNLSTALLTSDHSQQPLLVRLSLLDNS